MKLEPSAWANDTLGGWLLAWEREGEKHLRGKTGYWRHVEERMIRAILRFEGKVLEPGWDRFEIAARVEANHRNDFTFREISAAISARATPAPPPLTDEEWRYLADLLAMANDPIGRSIAEKAAARLA